MGTLSETLLGRVRLDFNTPVPKWTRASMLQSVFQDSYADLLTYRNKH
jgi:hypothetical protein